MKNLIIALLSGILLATGGAGPALADHHAVTVSSKEGIGHYFTDARGMTLYWFKMDGNSESACNGGCLEKWPVYYSEKVLPPQNIDSKEFGTITRGDGKKQTTFRGFPLYYFFKDKDAGDTFGQGVKDVWFVINPDDFPPR